MSIKGYHISYLVLALVMVMTFNKEVYSQGTESRRGSTEKSKLYIGFFVNPVTTSIANDRFASISVLNTEKGSGLNFSAEGGYYFSNILGVSVGIGYDSYATKLSMASYTAVYTTTDTENESFEMRINGKSISENQKISFVSIPVCLNCKYPFAERIGVYAKAGLNFGIPISKSFDGSGTFSYDGYYPAYPVLLQNAPAYGFPTDLNTVSSGDLLINSFNIGIVASGGVYYALNGNMQVLLGAHFNKSVGNISGYKIDSNYRLTSKANELNSFMGGSANAGVQSFGLSIGLKYYLR